MNAIFEALDEVRHQLSEMCRERMGGGRKKGAKEVDVYRG
jgi:hypothetical protein